MALHQTNATAPERSTNPTENISGLIERVTFFNEEGGFYVPKNSGRSRARELRGTDDSATPSASGHRGAVISAGDIRNVPRFDRIRTGCTTGALSDA